jgi:hypothetical protein
MSTIYEKANQNNRIQKHYIRQKVMFFNNLNLSERITANYSYILIPTSAISFIEHFPHFSSQPIHSKWLLNVIHSFPQYPMMDNGIICIARHIKRLKVLAHLRTSINQLSPAQPWHNDIRQDQVNGLFPLLTNHKSTISIRHI